MGWNQALEGRKTFYVFFRASDIEMKCASCKVLLQICTLGREMLQTAITPLPALSRAAQNYASRNGKQMGKITLFFGPERRRCRTRGAPSGGSEISGSENC